MKNIENPVYIAVDFDSTLAEDLYPNIGNPIPHAFEWLKRFEQMGVRLILWTMRSDENLTNAVNFCHQNGISFYSLNHNPEQTDWTKSPKCYASLYIDDKAVGCPLIKENGKRPYVNWDVLGPMVESLLKTRYSTRIHTI